MPTPAPQDSPESRAAPQVTINLKPNGKGNIIPSVEAAKTRANLPRSESLAATPVSAAQSEAEVYEAMAVTAEYHRRSGTLVKAIETLLRYRPAAVEYFEEALANAPTLCPEDEQ